MRSERSLMISMGGLLHGTLRFARASAAARLDASHQRPACEKRATLEPDGDASVLRPVIRYFALAFIFFQVATTAALATQVVLFEDATAAVLSPAELLSGAQAQPISPLVGEMAGRPEGGATEHLLIQIDAGKQSQASPMND
ncbi:hypothetical protein AU467_17740 [Mesorhizobium loti]|uniref:Uncharacterized protein n=1 Tax=Rhizobium loti TaxID=381 RepID=A0A101KU66_RHILI|nr:hypothetical protein AU467_17740 [Mesorhizobium loti]